ncbi:MAG: hypothetical protein BGO95_11450 [Micrococcales bacterium 73-13]|nr:MAG: hypothetical protein BGO95_11450 [Micrococcales bacterium 73-13]
MRRGARGGLLRGHAATVLVAALAAAFGVGLLAATEVLLLASASGPFELPQTARVVLEVVALVFTGIAIYVAAIVTTNTVSTIVVGRVREIALVRLLGGTAAGQRRRIAVEGLAAGALGAAIGVVGACLLVEALVLLGVATGTLPARDYPFLVPTMVVPVVAVLLSTWLAAWVGSRRVLAVAPIQALGAAVPDDPAALGRRPARTVAAAVLGVLGVLLLLLGVVVGRSSPFGLLVALPGGVLSFTGLMLGSARVIPPLLALVGRLLGRDPAAVLGTRNALRHPERSARAAIALVIGVALVTMFVVAGMTAREIALRAAAASLGERGAAMIDAALAPMMSIIAFLVGYSAVIAAVGLVSTLTVGVLQRTREFGLVRALGLSRAQLRRTISVEAVQLAATSVLLGVALGIGYGWIGAQSLLGAQQSTGLVVPVVPWWLLVALVAVVAVLSLAGSLVPARRAVRIPPVEAIAVE